MVWTRCHLKWKEQLLNRCHMMNRKLNPLSWKACGFLLLLSLIESYSIEINSIDPNILRQSSLKRLHVRTMICREKNRNGNTTLHKCQLRCHMQICWTMSDELRAFSLQHPKSLIKPSFLLSFLLFKVYICGELRANASQQTKEWTNERTKSFYFSHFDKLTNSTANRSICNFILFAYVKHTLMLKSYSMDKLVTKRTEKKKPSNKWKWKIQKTKLK